MEREEKTVVLGGTSDDNNEDFIARFLIREESSSEPIRVYSASQIWAAEFLGIDWVMTCPQH